MKDEFGHPAVTEDDLQYMIEGCPWTEVSWEKLAVARLQREVARSKSEGTMREKLMQELEAERGLRLESERRLREVAEESELGRTQMVALQQHFSRMEETVRTLLQSQGALEHTAVDTVDLMKAYKDKLSEEVRKQRESLERPGPLLGEMGELGKADKVGQAGEAELQYDCSGAEGDRDKETKLLLERLRALEAENSALAMENESQREQYERCLDEVANQVVQALLTQKDLREECLKLRTRVFDLEQQNRTLSVLFQQRVRPASDLLLQKLHSKIMGLSAGDSPLEPDRSKSYLLSRNTDSPPHDSHLNGKAGLPVVKCPSQLSLTVPVAAYPRSSCSSSELSISSACSEYSNSSYTWNEGKPSSLNWEKRVSLGSSAPGNICALQEEQPPTRRKECHILEGLKRLQRRRPKESPSLISMSGYKDCMNSNEGIYSLSLKCGGLGVLKPSAMDKQAGPGAGRRKFTYDSDDADDESSRAAGGDHWAYSKRLTHSLSDSLCSWDGGQGSEAGGGDGAKPPATTSYDSKEQPEKLAPSILSGFLPGGRTRATLNPSLLPFEVSSSVADRILLRLSDTDEAEDLPAEGGDGEQPERDTRELCRESNMPTDPPCERRNHSRAHSADSRLRPLSLLQQQKVTKSAQSDECIAAIFDTGGEPIDLNSQCETPGSLAHVPAAEYTELIPQGGPSCQSGGSTRNYSILESPGKAVELQSCNMGSKPRVISPEGPPGSSEHLQPHVRPQKLIKPPYNRAHKVHSVPPMHCASSPKANLSKIPSRGKGSPLKVAKGPATDMGTSSGGTPASSGQEQSPSSPPVKLSRFIKPSGSGGSSQSPKVVQAGSRLPCRTDWGKSPSSSSIQGSPLLPRRHLEHVDYGEQPTRDGQQAEHRSPSPPPPPGRTTSLLIRPNYDSSPQASKAGAHAPTASTVRGHLPISQTHPHHLPASLNDAILDASHSSEATPQKPAEAAGHHLQKSSASSQTPTRGSPKRVPNKLFHPSSAAGHTADPHELVGKGSRNILQKGSSLQSTFSSKRGQPEQENSHPALHKTSSSLPMSLQSHAPCTMEPQAPATQAPLNPAGLGTSPQNSAERAAKTRIPMGFKALVKSPPSLSSPAPVKQEKDHINVACKGAATASTPDPRGGTQAPFSFDAAPGSKPEARAKIRSCSMDAELPSQAPSENQVTCERADGESRLFKRSISVTTKPHLKPALGMNGAKARSQSFSSNYMERPSLGVSDGPGKIRTQIITNTGERGNSLTRQSSLGDGFQLKSATSPGENPPFCSYNRLAPQGAVTSSSSHQGLPGKGALKAAPKVDTARSVSKGEGSASTPQKEVRSLPLVDRFSLKNPRQLTKVAPHLHSELPSSPVPSPDSPADGTGSKFACPSKLDLIKNGLKQVQGKGQEEAEKPASPSACTIEEKVMMGIQENVQRGQGQDRAQASEAKQKTAPSLANWFGLRKSKLPALGGKKTDAPKGKEEKKELKIGSVLGGKQLKPDKKKEKKKNEMQRKDSQEQATTEGCDKLGSIMDHCNVQVGQLTNQIQHSTSYIGKDGFMKELLNRSVAKGDSHSAPLPGIPTGTQGTPRNNTATAGDSEAHTDNVTKIVTQKFHLRAENEEDPTPEPTCQDHMIGSTCQMRTLDSGIGTFPLPDSVARATGRHLPKSASTPEQALTETLQDLPSTLLPKWKVPSRSDTCQRAHSGITQSLSDPTMTGRELSDLQSRLPKPTPSGGMNSKKPTHTDLHMSPVQMLGVHENTVNKRRSSRDHALASDRALRVCTYSGSSSGSEVETEPETEATVKRPCCHTPPLKSRSSKPADQEMVKRSSMGNRLSIMDFYQQEVLAHYEKEEHRSSRQCSSPGKEGRTGDLQSKCNDLDETTGERKKLGFSGVSLESLNMLNSNGGALPESERKKGANRPPRDREELGRSDEPSSSCSDKPGGDNLGSLSDSLYDSFSSCTSQGSNEV
ncbi:nck-associated protein 5-like [Megalops cyprinoides]|uniref:nck-associated protein 5-like n=1 Tax=Megalops cyprinoides TaxID=118141 RepID=UPI0018654683|nr:nck-associated protein 5-like [Megalops cyprinoides]